MALRLAWTVGVRVVKVWLPFLALPAVALLASIGYAVAAGDAGFLRVFGVFFGYMAVGAAGSYAVHESGHALALGLCSGVERVDVECRFLRVSLCPVGTVTRLEAIGVALAGPGACVAISGVLALLLPGSGLQWWYLAQGLFLLPPFGDGLCLLRAARA
jgi:hypothetical protein